MRTDFQSSFIPKDTSQNSFSGEKVNILVLISILIFSISILGAIGLFVYKNMLKNTNEELRTQLVEAENNIDKDKIVEILTVDKKLQLSQSIISRHEIISSFMNDLASSTAISVAFNDFSFGSMDNAGVGVVMRGSAPSYAVVAFQESVFKQNKNYKRVSFSDLRLEQDGAVSFTVSLMLDPNVLIRRPDTPGSREDARILPETDNEAVGT